MSRATKRKHVFQELQDPNFTLTPGQEIARVEASRGNNLHEVSSKTGEHFLASMPSRFRRNVWIKRGDFVVLERIAEGVKVQAEIVRILYKDHVEQLKKDGLWPVEFDTCQPKDQDEEKVNSDSDSDLFVNTNHRLAQSQPTDSDSECSEEDNTVEPGEM
ncbi:hypothetical protein B566_EDAN012308 [Ephemera danica]|nr:hypothetical protein B566_EDAN012308 [Ephemera danica]